MADVSVGNLEASNSAVLGTAFFVFLCTCQKACCPERKLIDHAHIP